MSLPFPPMPNLTTTTHFPVYHPPSTSSPGMTPSISPDLSPAPPGFFPPGSAPGESLQPPFGPNPGFPLNPLQGFSSTPLPPALPSATFPYPPGQYPAAGYPYSGPSPFPAPPGLGAQFPGVVFPGQGQPVPQPVQAIPGMGMAQMYQSVYGAPPAAAAVGGATQPNLVGVNGISSRPGMGPMPGVFGGW